MRKLILTLLLISGISTAVKAEDDFLKLLHLNDFNVIYSDSPSGKTGLYFVNSEYHSPTTSFTIYDEEIQLVKELEIERPVYIDDHHFKNGAEPIYDKHYTDIPRIGIFPEYGGDEGWYEITCGIFSDDYNYVMPITNMFSYDDGNDWGKVTCTTGYQVFDIDNNPVLTITLPSGWGTDLGEPDIMYTVLAGKKYILIRVWDLTNMTDTQECATVIYRLDGSSKAKEMAIVPTGKISPRNPRKGEVVTVAIDEQFRNESCLVNVVSSDGRNLIQKTIAPGEGEIQFSTAGFPQGIYVVNVTGKAGKIETAKIIVR